MCILEDLQSKLNGLYVNGLFKGKGGCIVNIRDREEWSMVGIFQFVHRVPQVFSLKINYYHDSGSHFPLVFSRATSQPC